MRQPDLDDLPAFGDFRIDIDAGILYCGGKVVPLRRKAFDVLIVLYNHLNEILEYSELGRLAWKFTHVEPHNVQTTTGEVIRALGDKHGVHIENFPARGYRLVTDKHLALEAQALAKMGRAALEPPPPQAAELTSAAAGEVSVLPRLSALEPAAALRVVGDPRGRNLRQDPKFVLSVDGIILNSIGELVYERIGEETLRECRISYRRALEDFSFALVYGSQIRAKWSRSSEQSSETSGKEQKEPAESIISSLPDEIYDREVFDQDVTADNLLGNKDHQNQVRAYVQCMGRCMQSPFFVRLCKDWIAREAKTFLGTHPSLFVPTQDQAQFQFGKKYYRHELLKEVPTLLGEGAISTLLGFVPKFPEPHKKTDPYRREARIRFVVENVFTHLTTMYQYEKNSENNRYWRVPYALRAEVTKQSQTQMQRRLRDVIVRHALLFAMRQTLGADRRRSIIATLISMRGHFPFNVIREMLEELSLITLEPNSSSEERARQLIEEIFNTGDPRSSGPSDRYSLAKNSVLKELSDADPGEYETQLCALFPELANARAEAVHFLDLGARVSKHKSFVPSRIAA
jgi:DNA-binding winged helix-turn-helix (wHTH) protein